MSEIKRWLAAAPISISNLEIAEHIKKNTGLTEFRGLMDARVCQAVAALWAHIEEDRIEYNVPIDDHLERLHSMLADVIEDEAELQDVIDAIKQHGITVQHYHVTLSGDLKADSTK